MKKLMMAIMMAFMGIAAVGDTCSACGETPVAQCRAWDISIKLKTLGPKSTTCAVVDSDCGCVGPTKEAAYYLDNKVRKIKGYLWVCEYECGKPFNIVLWDATYKLPIIPVTMEAVDMESTLIYGKKATSVAITMPITGEKLELVLTGINGKMKRTTGEDGCYIKSITGYCSGLIAYVKPSTKAKTTVTGGSLCGEPIEEVTPATEWNARALSLCDACCWSNWCSAPDADDMVPAVGTWSMKYNKKVSTSSKSIYQLIPSYAQ